MKSTLDINIIGNNKPQYATKGSAGFDISAIESGLVLPGFTKMFRTGLFMAIPEGFELQIRSRSGLGAIKRVVVAQGVGTIDSDYRDEIKIVLYNAGTEPYFVERGDRIAQGVLAQIWQANFITVSKLLTTERDTGGFGSTGQ